VVEPKPPSVIHPCGCSFDQCLAPASGGAGSRLTNDSAAATCNRRDAVPITQRQPARPAGAENRRRVCSTRELPGRMQPRQLPCFFMWNRFCRYWWAVFLLTRPRECPCRHVCTSQTAPLRPSSATFRPRWAKSLRVPWARRDSHFAL